MNDLISRQAAVETVKKHYRVDNDLLEVIAYEIEVLPSAQPSATDTNVGGTNDTISRQAILDAVDGVTWYHQNKNGEMVHGANSDEHQAWYKAEDIYKAIESVPPTQPGWIPTSKKLPDGISQAIVQTNCGSIHEAFYKGKNGYGHEVWMRLDGSIYWDDEVVAWMLLPEPWEGEET